MWTSGQRIGVATVVLKKKKLHIVLGSILHIEAAHMVIIQATQGRRPIIYYFKSATVLRSVIGPAYFRIITKIIFC